MNEPIRSFILQMEGMKLAGIDAVSLCRSALGGPDLPPDALEATKREWAVKEDRESSVLLLGLRMVTLVDSEGISDEFLVKGLLHYLIDYYRVMAEMNESESEQFVADMMEHVNFDMEGDQSAGTPPRPSVSIGDASREYGPKLARVIIAKLAVGSLEHAKTTQFTDEFWRSWRLRSGQ